MGKRKIICPECAAEIYNYDGFSTSEVVIKCKFCNRYIKFKPLGNITKVIENPRIRTSAGARFW